MAMSEKAAKIRELLAVDGILKALDDPIIKDWTKWNEEHSHQGGEKSAAAGAASYKAERASAALDTKADEHRAAASAHEDAATKHAGAAKEAAKNGDAELAQAHADMATEHAGKAKDFSSSAAAQPDSRGNGNQGAVNMAAYSAEEAQMAANSAKQRS